MDVNISFRAALLQARDTELALRGDCLTEPEDVESLERFRTVFADGLAKLRRAGTIPEEPLSEFISQCARAIGWQFQRQKHEAAFAQRISDCFTNVENLIDNGLPEAEWSAVATTVAGLDAEFQTAQTGGQDSLPAELWLVVESGRRDEVLEQLDDILLHARDTGMLTPKIGWENWRLESALSVAGKVTAFEKVIPITCSYCNHEMKFSFELAGKEAECPECFRDIKLPNARTATADAEARARAATVPPPVETTDGKKEKLSALPTGWKDHFDPSPEARARLAAPPRYDSTELERLQQRIADTEGRKELWQKYFPRITAIGLPIDIRSAYELVIEEPVAVVDRLADVWPESEWVLSPQIGALFASEDMGFAEGVALLATDKEALKKKVRGEIRDRIRDLSATSLAVSSDYRWICKASEKVKGVYSPKLEMKCPDFSWKHAIEVRDEDLEAFAAGVTVEEGFELLLKGKSNKRVLTAAENEMIFDRIRSIPEMAGDMICRDGSCLTDSRNLPDVWRFRYYEPENFESATWILANPIVAARLLSSEIPRLMADLTGRHQLIEWQAKAQELLADDDLSVSRKAMILPVMLGLATDVLLITEGPIEAEDKDAGKKPVILKTEVEKPFRTAEVRELLDSNFPDKFAAYTGQNWILENLESQADTRRKGMSYGIKGVIAAVVIALIWFGVTLAMNKSRENRADNAEAQAAALARMVVEYEFDLSKLPDNIVLSELSLLIDGRPITNKTPLEAGTYVASYDHPGLKNYHNQFEIVFGEGMNLGRIKPQPATGTLTIASDPQGAAVTIDGRDVGTTGVILNAMPVGTNQLIITMAGYGSWSTNVVIDKNKLVDVFHRFGRGTARFETDPPGFFLAIGSSSQTNGAVEWQGFSSPKTPLTKEFLPGDYRAAFVHPTMGMMPVTEFTVTDNEEAQIIYRPSLASVSLTGLPASSKYWRGFKSFGTWLDWDPSWRFATEHPLTLFRLRYPGHLPQVYPLEFQDGSFSSPLELAMQPAGLIECWGSNSRGQSAVPEELQQRKFIDVAAGKYHTVALLEDLTVVAWGDNRHGQSTVPASLGKCMMVAAGENHTVALLTDGRVVSWGYNQSGIMGVPKDLGACVSISASGNRTIALRQDGGFHGWIYPIHFNLPAKSTGHSFVDISAGTLYMTALDDNGRPAVFVQARTKLGIGSLSAEGAAADSAGPFMATAGGSTYSLWLKPNGKIVAVGRKNSGARAPNSAGPFRSIAAGYTRFAAIARDGSVVIWGKQTGMTTRTGFERKTEEKTRVQYWHRAGSFLKVVCGENHYAGIHR